MLHNSSEPDSMFTHSKEDIVKILKCVTSFKGGCKTLVLSKTIIAVKFHEWLVTMYKSQKHEFQKILKFLFYNMEVKDIDLNNGYVLHHKVQLKSHLMNNDQRIQSKIKYDGSKLFNVMYEEFLWLLSA